MQKRKEIQRKMHVSKLAEQTVLLQNQHRCNDTQCGISKKLAAFVPLKWSTIVADKEIQSIDIPIQK
jgi:hypothetical protein